MNHFYTMVALDIARDRARDAEMSRRASLAAAAGPGPGRPGLIRHSLAVGFALISRGSAATVRRLDDHTADDLNRALATSK